MKLIDLANDIYDELGQTGLGIPFIRTWLGNNLGRLNVELNTDFIVSGSDLECVPTISGEAASIYKLLFEEYYYNRQGRSNLGANSYVIESVQEGDTRISVAKKTDIAKQYQVLAKDTRVIINDKVKLYRLNSAVPQEASSELITEII